MDSVGYKLFWREAESYKFLHAFYLEKNEFLSSEMLAYESIRFFRLMFQLMRSSNLVAKRAEVKLMQNANQCKSDADASVPVSKT